MWGNSFSNESALCRMSDGSMARFNEFRRVGHPGTVGMSMYGTEGCYEEQVGSQRWVTKDRRSPWTSTDLLRCGGRPGHEAKDEPWPRSPARDGTHLGVSRDPPRGAAAAGVHGPAQRPQRLAPVPGARLRHGLRAGTLPPNNVWQAARYLIPGLVAHESALKGGALLEVPDLGDPPAGWKAR